MSRTSEIAHRTTVVLMAIGVLVATGDGFAQSYAGLYHWAIEHGLTGWKAQSFPLMVDLFILVGELGLFALALEGHRLTRSGMSWADMALPGGIATAGWTVSVIFNIGSVKQEFAAQATAAVPPVASMLGLLVLLRTLHRLVGRPPAEAAEPVRLVQVERVTEEPAEEVEPPAIEAPRTDEDAEPSRTDEPRTEESAPAVRPAAPIRTRPHGSRLVALARVLWMLARTAPAASVQRSQQTRTDRTDDPYDGPRTATGIQVSSPYGRAEWVAALAQEIRIVGADWTPDYEDLMERTERSRSWCEKRVREARDAARTGVRAGAR
jgi:hypothetical protein